MSPIPYISGHDLEKRWWWDDYDDGSSGWYSWGRWVLLGVIIGVAFLCVLLLQCASCRRVRHGHRPIHGTAWMVPPSYYQSQQQYNNDPLPVYKAEPGEGDAARYDGQNFVPVSQNNYAPPPGPPPSHAGPPQGPPPSQATASNSDYYRPTPGPPPGPPPGREELQAPAAAKYKN